jgi:putative transposase
MARTPRNAKGNSIYHILNRANGREKIFKKEKDYESFLKLLAETKEKYPMRILSFCIMPNHWHLVLYPEKDEDLSRFMRYLTHTHTQRYHAHYKTIGYGHVYQGRYKSFPVQKDNHFLQLCRYVERNPLRAGLVEKAQNWKYSSLYIRQQGSKEQKNILSQWPIQETKNYTTWVNTLQKDEEEKLKMIRYSIQKGRPFGNDSWVKTIATKLNILSTLRERGRPKKGT